MELLAVRTARLVARMNAEELNPKGKALAHDFMRMFVKRYNFLKVPTPEEITSTEDNGITFTTGKLGEVGITKVVLFDWGVAVETNATTDASDAVLQDMLDWGAQEFQLANRPDLITRRSYVSEIVFRSDIDLNALNRAVLEVSNHLTQMVAAYLGQSEPFGIHGFSIAFDSSQSKQLYTPFQIYHLPDTPYSERKYISGAPLRTADHFRIIEQLEDILR